MASIVLSNAGSAAGAHLLGSKAGGSLGQIAGTMIGQVIDRSLFGGRNKKQTHGSRINDLSIQQSAYGQVIPIVYGTVKIAGNIIWAGPVAERKATTTQAIGGKGSSIRHTHTEYIYSVSLAIALCEGEITAVQRIWADEQLFDMSLNAIRIYKGSNTQLPDPLIESIEGIGNTPAYRDLAYIVIEDLNLTRFGNRIPFFSFEVKRVVRYAPEHKQAEDLIKSIVMIPGSGEFVYDTITQYKQDGDISHGQFISRGPVQPINRHTAYNKANVLGALDDMQNTLPNLEWVAPVVGWFGTSLDIGECNIKPGVEYQHSSITTPDEWKVSQYNRSTAHLITQLADKPIYGGTTSDASVLRFLDELRRRQYKIMFYPMLFIDTLDKPWRGRMYGSSFSIKSFFTKDTGYKNFILHYARLVQGKVDAFIIGSEMVGLNKVTGVISGFPAVDYWLELAAEVKTILGEDVKVSYAADWSEYHHAENGWYHLDPLWASPNIDFVGIDAYFPLTEGKNQGKPLLEEIIAGWDQGEGYEYYYRDHNRAVREKLEEKYAWKNLQWWWENEHVNPDGNKTKWQPRSKKIWFTEYGFPSVDSATNQPNVFWSNDSIESHLPYGSEGKISLSAQRLGITATEMRWANSEIVERKFLWTWDARPFPHWPDLDKTWSDGACWYRGHWVQGKLGAMSLAQVVVGLCRYVGLTLDDVDVSLLHEVIDGLVINKQTTPRMVLEALQQSYFFDVTANGGKLHCIPRNRKESRVMDATHLLPLTDANGNTDTVQIKIIPEVELPQTVVVNFIGRYSNYEIGNQHAHLSVSASNGKQVLQLPLVLQPEYASLVAHVNLLNMWLERWHYSFMLPPRYIYLVPGDVVQLKGHQTVHAETLIRITHIYLYKDRRLLIEGVQESFDIYNTRPTVAVFRFDPNLDRTVGDTHVEVLDLPILANEELEGEQSRFMVAACGTGTHWSGAVLYADLYQSGKMAPICTVKQGAVIGTVVDKLWPVTTACIMDRASKIRVNILNGILYSITEAELAEGINTALIGNEIVQFQSAKLVKPYQYELSNLLRGRYGTELHTLTHLLNERFVLLDDRLHSIPLSGNYAGQGFTIKAVGIGTSEVHTNVRNFKYHARALQPFPPVYLRAKVHAPLYLVVLWYRRCRISGRANNSWSRGIELWDHTDRIVLGEETEQYQVLIYRNDKIIHTATCLGTEYRLDAESWKAQGLPEQWDKLVIKVAQISGTLGVGPYTAVTLNSEGSQAYHEESL